MACRSGWEDLHRVFDGLAAAFAGCDAYDFELVAAGVDGDLAYTAGIERYRARTSAGAVVENALRATHVYRREGDRWKIVHRHGDHLPTDVF